MIDTPAPKLEAVGTQAFKPSYVTALAVFVGSLVTFGFLIIGTGFDPTQMRPTGLAFIWIAGFSTLGGLAMTMAIATDRIHLQLDDDGWESLLLWGRQRHLWTNCGPFRVDQPGAGLESHGTDKGHVVCDLVPGAPGQKKNLHNPDAPAAPVGPENNYGMKPQDLADLMNRYRDAALERMG